MYHDFVSELVIRVENTVAEYLVPIMYNRSKLNVRIIFNLTHADRLAQYSLYNVR